MAKLERLQVSSPWQVFWLAFGLGFYGSPLALLLFVRWLQWL